MFFSSNFGELTIFTVRFEVLLNKISEYFLSLRYFLNKFLDIQILEIFSALFRYVAFFDSFSVYRIFDIFSVCWFFYINF